MNNTSSYTTLRYQSLSAALGDLNAGGTGNAVTADSGAAVAVHLDPTGKKTVTLMKDLTESASINVTKSLRLNLNGKTLSLNEGAELTFGEGTNCSIDGTAPGSTIRKEYSGSSANLLVSNGDLLTVWGGTYELTGSISGHATGFRANAGKLELRRCTLEATNSSGSNAATARTLYVNPGAAASVVDSEIVAEAVYGAYAVMAAGNVKIENSQITGETTYTGTTGNGSYTAMVGDTGSLELHGSTVTSNGQTVLMTGIHNSGKLVLEDTTVNTNVDNTGNTAQSCGIFNQGTATAVNSGIFAESTTQLACGINNQGSLSLENVSLEATSDSGTVYGIQNLHIVTDTDTVIGNVAIRQLKLTVESASGGISGIFNQGTVSLCDSTLTVTGNLSSPYGIASSGKLTVENTTITVCGAEKSAYGVDNNGKLSIENTTVTVSCVKESAYGIHLGNIPECTGCITGLTATVTSVNGVPYGIKSEADLLLERAKIYAESQSNKAYGLRSSGTAEIHFGDITANTYNSAGTNSDAYGIYNSGTMTISDSTVMGDAPGDDAAATLSCGIVNAVTGILYCIHTDATATHTGLSNHGKVYAEGGVFTGRSHGGFYFAHGADGIAYVNDAVMRCGHYTGVHTEYFANNPSDLLGGGYVGGGSDAYASNMTVYLDGCTFAGPVCFALVLRGTHHEQGNTVNMSNCTMAEQVTTLRIDVATAPDNQYVPLPHHVNLGAGLDPDTFAYHEPDTAPALTTSTNESYRKTRAYFRAQVEA